MPRRIAPEAVLFWLLAITITGGLVWILVAPETVPPQVWQSMDTPWPRLVIGSIAFVVGMFQKNLRGIFLTGAGFAIALEAGLTAFGFIR